MAEVFGRLTRVQSRVLPRRTSRKKMGMTPRVVMKMWMMEKMLEKKVK